MARVLGVYLPFFSRDFSLPRIAELISNAYYITTSGDKANKIALASTENFRLFDHLLRKGAWRQHHCLLMSGTVTASAVI